MRYQTIKRLFDVLLAGMALAAAWPLLVWIAAAVLVAMGRPILFWQQRPGLGGRLFWMCKFRTMTVERDRHGGELPDAVRLTPLGRWLRKTSLDELPELWNVLRGDMSLVGPRPLLCEYLPLYTARQMRRHEAPPGITGWAQVNGRNALAWEERLELDVWYVEHRSLRLDLAILARTVLTIVRRQGISAAGHATMPKFTAQRRNAA